MSCVLIHTISGSDSITSLRSLVPMVLCTETKEKGKNSLPEFLGHHKTQYASESTWDSVLTPILALLPRPVRSVLKIGGREYAGEQPGKREEGAVVLGFF